MAVLATREAAKGKIILFNHYSNWPAATATRKG
jgi:hypothetical protein